jgi:hypothetical protein
MPDQQDLSTRRGCISRMLRTFAILGLWACLPTQALFAAPDTAQASGAAATGTRRHLDINNLFQHWIHSREEEQPDAKIEIFRPAASMDFPPSRFRMEYKFARDGRCEFLFLAPNDGHYFKPCTWKISADKLMLQISANRGSTSYKIAELNGKILRFTPLQLPPTD